MSRAPRARRNLMLASGVCALASAGIIGFYLLRAAGELPPEDPAPPDVTDLSAAGEAVGAGRGVMIQLADRDDPTRQFGELLFDRMEPLEGQRYLLERPRTFLFLKDGRTVFIRADRATIRSASEQSQPESGVFEGNGEARIYDAAPDGSRIDPEVATPAGTAWFPTMAFDRTLGSLSTEDRVDFDSADSAGFFNGFRLYVDQISERASLIEVFRGGRVVHLARGSAAEPEARPAAPPPPGAPGPGGGRSAPRPKPVENRYHAQFSDGVVVEQGLRSVGAQNLDVWARLRDNRLPPNAIARLNAPPRRGSGLAAGPSPQASAQSAAPHDESVFFLEEPRRAPSVPAQAPGAHDESVFFVVRDDARREQGGTEPGPPPAAEPDDEPIILTWDGPLVIRPLDDQPNELRRDHLTLRFRSDPDRGVVYRDDAKAESARCRAFTYFATTRRAAAQGSGPGTVVFESAQTGTIAAGEVRADLGTGLITVPTAGIATDPRTDRTIAWSEKASVELERLSDGGSTVRTAIFEGEVHAADGESAVSGGFLMADFATDTTTDGERTWLRKVLLDESARAEQAETGQIAADRLEAWFQPGADGEVDPTFVVATGNVSGEHRFSTVTARSVEASLRRSGSEIEVTRALARGGVLYHDNTPGRDRIEAAADEVSTDPVARRADLLGTPEAPARIASGGTTVLGPQMSLDEVARRIRVFGAGRFEHRETPDAADPAVTATWTEEMTYDDLAGVAMCFGSVEGRSVDPAQEQTLRGHALRVEITPLDLAPVETRLSYADAEEEQVVVLPEEPAVRSLLRARVTGGVLEQAEGPNATVESREYGPGEGSARSLGRVLYLEGPRIDADDAAGFLHVPGAGRLLVHDRREAEPQAGVPSRASSLFTWAGSMRVERASGRVRMHDRVALTHRLLDDGRTLLLECRELDARVRTPGCGPVAVEGEGLQGELVSASATGAVYARMGSREVVCGRFEYDAATGIAEAFPGPGEPILFSDSAAATGTSAQGLKWNLKTDRIDLRGAGPIVAPR